MILSFMVAVICFHNLATRLRRPGRSNVINYHDRGTKHLRFEQYKHFAKRKCDVKEKQESL